MKILGFLGSPRKEGNTAILMNEVLSEAKKGGHEVNIYYLNETNIQGCQGCLHCKKHGRCRIDDDMQSIYDEIQAADSIVFGTPVYWGGESSQFKTFFDRWFAFIISPPPNYVVSLRPGKKGVFFITQGREEEDMFQYLPKRFSSILKGMLGFSAVYTFVAPGLRKVEAKERPELLAKAREAGKFLIS